MGAMLLTVSDTNEAVSVRDNTCCWWYCARSRFNAASINTSHPSTAALPCVRRSIFFS